MRIIRRPLDLPRQSPSVAEAPPRAPLPRGPAATVDRQLAAILGFLRRQFWLIALVTLASATLAVLYLRATPPLYSASARLLIEPGNPTASSDLLRAIRPLMPEGLDAGVVESQIEVIRSDDALATVARRLDIPSWIDQGRDAPGWARRVLSSVKSTLLPPSPVAEDPAAARARLAQRFLAKYLDVRRVADSYVVNVSYTSPNPAVSAVIANAFAELYIESMSGARAHATDEAIAWLDGQLAQAEIRVTEADDALRAFRAENNIIASGHLNEQELTGISAALVTARAERAEAEARLRQFQAFTPEQRAQAAVPEALSNPIILNLRNQYLTAAARLAEVQRLYGRDTLDAQRLQSEMTESKRLVADEIGRMELSYEAELAAAGAREDRIQQDFDTLRDTLLSADKAIATLQRLEWQATAAAQVVETLEAKRRDALELRAQPFSDARIISPAVAPGEPSAPKEMIVLMLAIIAGGMIGGALALIRELRDDGFRTPEQVEQALGLPVIGMLPRMGRRGVSQAEMRSALAATRIWCDPSLGGGPVTLGVMAALPGEGCSTIAAHLAARLSEKGGKVTLVEVGEEADREIPLAAGGGAPRSPERLIGAEAAKRGEVSVLDLPPLATSTTGIARGARANALVLVIRWRGARRVLLADILDANPELRERAVGVVLNQVNFGRMRRFADGGGRSAHFARAHFTRDRSGPAAPARA